MFPVTEMVDADTAALRSLKKTWQHRNMVASEAPGNRRNQIREPGAALCRCTLKIEQRNCDRGKKSKV